MKKFILLLAFFAFVSTIYAQKTAYVNLDSVVELMPEYKKAQSDLEAYYKQLTKKSYAMQTEIDNKTADLNKKANELTPSLKSLKETEIQNLQEKKYSYDLQMEQFIKDKNMELVKPIYDKAKKAVTEVASAGGYKSVIDISSGIVLYFDPADDIFIPVLKKLGLK